MKNIRYIFNLFLPYLISFMCPVFTSLALVIFVGYNYKNQIITEKQNNIERSFEEFQEKFELVEEIGYAVTTDDRAVEYAWSCINLSQSSQMLQWELIGFLNNLSINEVVAEILIYDGVGGSVLTTNARMADSYDYFKYSLRIGMDIDQYVKELKASAKVKMFRGAKNVFVQGEEKKVIEYGIKFPYGYSKNPSLHLVIMIDVEKIFSELLGQLENGGEIYVYNKEGGLLYSNGTRFEKLLVGAKTGEFIRLEEEGLYGIVLETENGLWRVETYIPDVEKNSLLNFGNLSAWSVTIISILFSIFCSVYFTVKNKREIDSVMILFENRNANKNYNSDTGEYNNFKLIKQSVKSLVEENIELFDNVEKMEKLKKQKILAEIIHSENVRADDIKEIECVLQPGPVIILCIQYQGAEYRGDLQGDLSLKDYINHKLVNAYEREMDIINATARETVCILYCSEFDSLDLWIRNLIMKLNMEIFYPMGIDVEIGVGKVVASVYESNISYRQAKEVIAYNKITGQNLIMSKELDELTDDYYFPESLHEFLYNYILAGKLVEAKKLIQTIYDNNFIQEGCKLSLKAWMQLKERLCDSLSTVADRFAVPIEDILYKMEGQKNVEDYFKLCAEILGRIENGMVYLKRAYHDGVVEKVMKYIKEHYSDSALSLVSLSSDLGYQKDYLSKLFKEQNGNSPIDAIEKIRIEKACEHLKNMEIRIVKVAELVGYNSDKSFRRAFKKVMGITPAEYRESIERVR